MPFQITKSDFGPVRTDSTEPLTEYLLEHTETGEFITVLPGYGGVLRRLVLRKGHDLFALLNTPDSPQALLADETYACALLAPFPSRIRHGIYTFNGEVYTLHMNEANRDAAIHGFVHGERFMVIDETVTDYSARIIVQYVYPGNAPGYPFPFVLTVSYELIQSNRLLLGTEPEKDKMCALRITYELLNSGHTSCPAAFGWHPYFSFTNESIDEMTLSLPDRTRIDLAENMIPNGLSVPEKADTRSLHEHELNTPFVLDQPTNTDNGYAETILTSQSTGVRLVVGQQTGPGKLNYLVCYTPGKRDSIAIEPMTANVDAFNNGEGLATLQPGDTLSGSMWVRLD